MRAFIVAAIFVGALSPVAAAETTRTAEKVITYSDLNLASEAGRTTLDQRIRAAARQVCRNQSVQGGLRAHLDASRCEAEAVSAAQAKLALSPQSAIALR